MSTRNLFYGGSGTVISKLIKPAYEALNKKDEYFQQKDNDVIASGSIVSIYIVYSLSLKTINSGDVLKNCLFGETEVKKSNNTADPHKWQYSGYSLAFDRTGQFTHPDGGWGRNVIIFGADLLNSRHTTNKIQNILVLGEAFVQKINDTTIYAGKMYSPHFSVENKTFCLSLHYNGDDSYLFVNGKQVIQFKAKDSEIKLRPLTLGSISTTPNLSQSDIEDSKLHGNVYDFSVDYSAITTDKILQIHGYLMKKMA